MEIRKRQAGAHLELTVTGRLDAYWADHLSGQLAEVIRDGAHHLRLDLAGVDFMSSAGLRVLLQYFKQLKSIQGSLVVSEASAPVKTVLALAGFEELLGLKAGPTVAPAPSQPAEAPSRIKLLERAGATFEVYERAPYQTLACQAMGNPELLDGARFRESHCRTLQFPGDTFAVGLGAFGHDFQDCRGRFGELLAAAGAVAYHPTDGTNVPDYQVQTGAFLPDAQVLYCLKCEGQFSHLVRFEAKPEPGAVPFSELVEACLSVTRAELAGLILVAETASLVGAALKRSPVSDGPAGATGAPFRHPDVREWLSFTPERAFAKTLTVVVGVAASNDRPVLDQFLRPLGKRAWPIGHFHAAAFSYRPIKKGEIDLQPTVSALFNGESLQGILHLVNDERDIVGAGQSEFVRGACWVGPIGEVAVEKGGA
ncbi:MAG: STAS domain-containing protein [Nitrospirota bacterium]